MSEFGFCPWCNVELNETRGRCPGCGEHWGPVAVEDLDVRVGALEAAVGQLQADMLELLDMLRERK